MKLDLGCGLRKKPGYKGVDIIPKADIVADLNKKLPIKTNSVDAVNCHNVLEHVDDLNKTMLEIWRVCKPGAKVHITVPHFSGYLAFYEYHLRFFNITSFIDFTDGYRMYQPDIKGKFKIVRKRITFPKWKLHKINHLIEPLVNFNHSTQIIYDEHFLHSLFNTSGIDFEMEVVK